MKPSLAKSLLGLFSIMILIESLFIGVLCYDVLKMESAAKMEFDAAKRTQDIYQVMDTFSRTLTAIGDARRQLKGNELSRKGETLKSEFLLALEPKKAGLRAIGIDSASLEKMQSAAIRSFDLWLHYEDSSDPEEQKRLKIIAVRSLGTCYKQFTQGVKTVQELLRRPAVKPFLGIEPEQLLQMSAIVNILYVLCLFAFVERKITRPLSELTEACELIRKRQPLQKVQELRSEIGVLQNSFTRMSEQVIENESRRKSYVGLLQTLQISAIGHIRTGIASLSASDGLIDRARSRLKMTLNSLSKLEELLGSMTEQLDDGSQEQLKVRPSVCNSVTLVQEAADSVEGLLKSRKINLEVENQNIQFSADAMLIARVLLNLISNAIKYSPEGATVKVVVQKASADTLEIQVIDSGPGISMDEQNKLFKRFSQLSPLDGVKRSGSGLGLLICKEIVEAHGGEIGCTSKPGAGSNFWFRVPLEGSAAVHKFQPNHKSAGLEKKSIKSIKRGFVVMLAAFVCTQGIIFFALDHLLLESKEKAGFYAHQKNLLLNTESCFLSFVQWGNRMQRAAINMDMAALYEGLPLFKSQNEKLAKFLARVEKESKLNQQLSDIYQKGSDLVQEMEYGKENPTEFLEDLHATKMKLTDKIVEINKSWEKALALQNEGFQSSYDFSKQLRTKILQVLLLSALADALLIASAVFISLKLVGKILILKSKTESFAASTHIQPSLAGKDELCFLDQRLCQVANEIFEAESKRQELLSVINHDLRTPLTSIVGTMENLNAGVFGSLQGGDCKLAELTLRDLENLLAQINNLLLLEKIESGAYIAESQEFCLRALIDECVEDLDAFAKSRNLTITVINPKDFQDTLVRGDRNLLYGAISNVLKNAVAAADNGSEIELAIHRKESDLIISIKNFGKSVDSELAKQIFERFRLVDGKPLAGLGLPLAFQSCRILGGSIRLQQDGQGEGTTVEIRLPQRTKVPECATTA